MNNIERFFEIKGDFVCPECRCSLSSHEDMSEIEEVLSSSLGISPIFTQCQNQACRKPLILFFKTIKPLEVDSQGRITKKGEFQKMVLLATMAKEG